MMKKWFIAGLLIIILGSLVYLLQGVLSVVQGQKVLDKIKRVNWKDREAVDEIIREVNPQQYRFLSQTVRNGNTPDKMFSAYLLTRKGMKENQVFLVESLHSEDPGERRVSLELLRDLWFNEAGPDSRQILEQSRILLADGKNEEALRKLTFLLRRKPQFAEAYSQRALVYYTLGRYQEAVRDCKDAIELNPWHFAAYHGMGESLIKLNRYEEAKKAFEEALVINPDLKSAQLFLERIRQLNQQRNRTLALNLSLHPEYWV